MLLLISKTIFKPTLTSFKDGLLPMACSSSFEFPASCELSSVTFLHERLVTILQNVPVEYEQTLNMFWNRKLWETWIYEYDTPRGFVKQSIKLFVYAFTIVFNFNKATEWIKGQALSWYDFFSSTDFSLQITRHAFTENWV